MREKLLIMSNALVLALSGIRIEFYNRILPILFKRHTPTFICAAVDRYLLRLRKEFLLLEKRHLSILQPEL